MWLLGWGVNRLLPLFWPQRVRPADIQFVRTGVAVFHWVMIGQRGVTPATDFGRWKVDISEVDCWMDLSGCPAGLPPGVVERALFTVIGTEVGQYSSPLSIPKGEEDAAPALPDFAQGVCEIEFQQRLQKGKEDGFHLEKAMAITTKKRPNNKHQVR